MPDKTADELRAERRALDAQIAEAEGREPPPLKISELAGMDDEEIAANTARVKAAARDAARRENTRPSPGETLNRYFEGPGSDTGGERERTPAGLRPKGGGS